MNSFMTPRPYVNIRIKAKPLKTFLLSNQWLINSIHATTLEFFFKNPRKNTLTMSVGFSMRNSNMFLFYIFNSITFTHGNGNNTVIIKPAKSLNVKKRVTIQNWRQRVELTCLC